MVLQRDRWCPPRITQCVSIANRRGAAPFQRSRLELIFVVAEVGSSSAVRGEGGFGDAMESLRKRVAECASSTSRTSGAKVLPCVSVLRPSSGDRWGGCLRPVTVAVVP